LTGAAGAGAAVAVAAVAGAAVVVAVEVTVVTTAGFGASCFVQPVKAIANTSTAMIAEIFFMFIHPLSSLVIYLQRVYRNNMNWIMNALQARDIADISTCDGPVRFRY
jgi:hypothetical protein